MSQRTSDGFSPGECHVILFHSSAMRWDGSIDYLLGDDVLIHLRPDFARGILRINDFVAGEWREELPVLLTSDEARGPLEVRVLFREMAAEIFVGERRPILFERETPLLEATRIQHGSNIEWRQLVETSTSADSADVSATSLMSNTNRINFTLNGRPPENSRLQVLVDGRLSAELELSALDVGVQPMRLTYNEDACVMDGMRAVLVLASGQSETTLGSCTVSTRFAGGLDRCNESLVRGWAANLSDPGALVLVDIFLDGVYQGSAKCERSRNDLKRLGEQYATAGFLFKFSSQVFLPESRDARIDVFIHNSDCALQHSPWWICRKIEFQELRQEALSTVALDQNLELRS